MDIVDNLNRPLNILIFSGDASTDEFYQSLAILREILVIEKSRSCLPGGTPQYKNAHPYEMFDLIIGMSHLSSSLAI
ncbi:MAG: hypothetical protein MMC33_002340 [Icmadophila ericetorum]|nr:hypothetical protein [Icmadophila ericetorum]